MPTRDGLAISPGVLCPHGILSTSALPSRATALMQVSGAVPARPPSPLSGATLRAPAWASRELRRAASGFLYFSAACVQLSASTPSWSAWLTALGFVFILPSSNSLIPQAFYLKFSILFTHRDLSQNVVWNPSPQDAPLPLVSLTSAASPPACGKPLDASQGSLRMLGDS